MGSFPTHKYEKEEGGETIMSAFMVQDTTINYVVNWLRRERERLPSISHELKELGFDPSKQGWAARLGQAMFRLNHKAVIARYGRGKAGKFRPLDYRFAHTEAVSLMQVLKSLHCWLYQCNEGDVSEGGLYGLFATNVQLYLMETIITRLPEYEEAYWG